MTDTKYFAFIDGEQRGPYDLNQLVDVGVRPSTYVWCKNMDDWHRADEVEEIRNLFRHHIESHRERPQHVSETVPNPFQKDEPPLPQEKRPRFSRFGGIDLPDVTKEEPDISNPPQVSMVLAIASMIICFLPTGIAAVFFSYKAQNTWEKSIKEGNSAQADNLKREAHEYERLAKMWLGLTVAFGLIAWTLIVSLIGK